MKIPKSPPFGNSEVFSQVELTGFAKVEAPTVNGRYVHWDKLSRLKPPELLSHEQWWALIKFRRLVSLRPLPFTDVLNRSFQAATPDQAMELLHGLDTDAAGQLLMSSDAITAASRDRYIVSSLMEEAITSSQLEGAATTRAVAKNMLRSGRQPRSRSEQMIANNYAAMQKIREIQAELLSPAMIFDLHRILTENAIDDLSGVGRLRRPDEQITVVDHEGQLLHTPPPAGQLNERLQALCDFANGKTPSYFLHPVVRSVVLHFWLAYDHPFIDGNGRCARALFYWSMLHSKYWLCEFISISEIIKKAPARYGRAFLYTETDDNDLTYFVLYHLNVIRKSIDSLQKYLSRKQAEVREAEKVLRDDVELNHRQMALLANALRHPDARFTILEHQITHDTVYETARKDLFDLERRGFLKSTKIGRTYYFLPSAKLEKRRGKYR